MRYRDLQEISLSAPIVSPAATLALLQMGETVDGYNSVDRGLIRNVCLSHERLRAELAGAEKVIDRMDRKQRHGCTDALCKECDQ